MKVEIVLVSGKQGAGKDETFKQLREYVARKANNEKEHVVIQHFFAHPIREVHDMVRDFMEKYGYPIPEGFEIKDGGLMQDVGAWGRKRYGPNVWLDIAKKKIDRSIHIWKGNTQRLTVVVTDCRFENEFDGVPGAFTVRLECPEEVRRKRAENWRENTMHESEVGLDAYAAAGKFKMYIDTEKVAPRSVAESIYAELKTGAWAKDVE